MKKRWLILLFVILIFILNLFKHPFVFYLPFNIPGTQMAATIPPFGIFIESKYKNENKKSPVSVIQHERVHWQQYERMGLFSFYYNYFKYYIIYGRINHPMEREARKNKKINN